MQETNTKMLKSKERRDSLALKQCYDADTEEENFQELRVICSELEEQIQKQGSRRENKKGKILKETCSEAIMRNK